MPHTPEGGPGPPARAELPAVVRHVSGEPLSIRGHTVDPKRVYKQLFGRDAEVDERTGGLVHRTGKPRDA